MFAHLGILRGCFAHLCCYDRQKGGLFWYDAINKMPPRARRSRREAPRHRGFCYTHNTDLVYVAGNEALFQTYADELCNQLDKYEARYYCFQFEIAPTTGRVHIQGYMYFNEKKSFGTFRAALQMCMHGCHIEQANGTAQQNRDYCSKNEGNIPGTFREKGQMPLMGKRNDLDEIARSIVVDRRPASELAVDLRYGGAYIRYFKGIERLEQIVRCTPRDPAVPVTVHWWYGSTGTGKSRDAFATFPGAYRKSGGDHWWNHYNGHSTVIIDDYRPNMCTFADFLRILDRYPTFVQSKGGVMELTATTIVITTISRPEYLWRKQTDEALDQLVRRLTTIVKFGMENGAETRVIEKNEDIIYVPMTRGEMELRDVNFVVPPVNNSFFNR